MSQHYLLRNKYAIPNAFFIAVASWVIALATVTVVLVAIWIAWSTMNFDLFKHLPKPLSLLIGACGAYAGIGSICLYVTMWVYWIAAERAPLLKRIGWLLVLLFGVHYGALLYACYVWKTALKKVPAPYPVAGVPLKA